jgi:hypothetical protein
MKMMLKKFALLALPACLLLLQPHAAHAWTQDINCEGGTLGQQTAQGGANNFSTSFTLTTYANAQAATGSQSCKMSIVSGTSGWGQWGGIYMFPTQLGVGSKVWARVSLFVPTGFDISTNDGMLKFIRIHTASPSSSNQGYHDLEIANPGFSMYTAAKQNVSPSYIYGYEDSGTQDYPVGVSPTNNVAMGKWETYEVYLSLDSAGKASGGQGEVRVWKNNQLLFDLTSDKTLADSSTYAESLFIFTWWNEVAPLSQSVYVDDIIVTSDTPSNKDAAGNPFIGGPTPGGASTTPPPSSPPATTVTPDPPSNVSVQ